MKKITLAIKILVFITAFLWITGIRVTKGTGSSMLPTISENSILITQFTRGAELEVGDIALFYSPEQDAYLCHRAIYKSPVGYHFKGDNNHYFDPFVPSEYVVAKVIFIVP